MTEIYKTERDPNGPGLNGDLREGRCAPISTRSRRDRLFLGAFLGCVTLLMSLICLAVHETGHLVAHRLLGSRIYGFYLSPFLGQVFAIIPKSKPPVYHGMEALAGVVATQTVGYAIVMWLRARQVGRRLWPETGLACLAVLLLVSDPIYLVLGSVLGFGDPREAMSQMDLPVVCTLIAGLVLLFVNARVFRNPAAKWFSHFCPDRTKKEHVSVLNYSLLFLVGAALCAHLIVYLAT
jgi:hypothetical protein